MSDPATNTIADALMRNNGLRIACGACGRTTNWDVHFLGRRFRRSLAADWDEMQRRIRCSCGSQNVRVDAIGCPPAFYSMNYEGRAGRWQALQEWLKVIDDEEE